MTSELEQIKLIRMYRRERVVKKIEKICIQIEEGFKVWEEKRNFGFFHGKALIELSKQRKMVRNLFYDKNTQRKESLKLLTEYYNLKDIKQCKKEMIWNWTEHGYKILKQIKKQLSELQQIDFDDEPIQIFNYEPLTLKDIIRNAKNLCKKYADDLVKINKMIEEADVIDDNMNSIKSESNDDLKTATKNEQDTDTENLNEECCDDSVQINMPIKREDVIDNKIGSYKIDASYNFKTAIKNELDTDFKAQIKIEVYNAFRTRLKRKFKSEDC